MCFLLGVKSFAVITELEMSMCDGLIATGYLNVIFSKKIDIAIQTFHEAIDSCLELFEILVH